MNVQELRYVVAVAQAGSINKAALNLYVSQSTLSRAVQEVEAQIGISLFQRTNKGAIPTHDGRHTALHAGHFGVYRILSEAVRGQKASESGAQGGHDGQYHPSGQQPDLRHRYSALHKRSGDGISAQVQKC